jgi:hypothetical protein
MADPRRAAPADPRTAARAAARDPDPAVRARWGLDEARATLARLVAEATTPEVPHAA